MKATAVTIAMVAAAVLCVSAFTGCGETKLQSRWLDRDITIDGKGSDWHGGEAYYDEENAVRIGFFNDEKHLYVFVSTRDAKTQVKALMNGFTIWIDPGGGKEKAFGVRYPRRRGWQDSPEGEPSAERYRQRGRSFSVMRVEMIRKAVLESRDELEIVGAGEGEVVVMHVDESRAQGIDAMIAMTNRVLEHELRIPLSAVGDSFFDLGVEPGAEIGVGFVTGKPSEGRPSGMPPGGMGGGGFPGGGPPGGPGGMGGGMRSGMGRPPGMEPVEIWAKLTLANGS
jgi:hypothetical protein